AGRTSYVVLVAGGASSCVEYRSQTVCRVVLPFELLLVKYECVSRRFGHAVAESRRLRSLREWRCGESGGGFGCRLLPNQRQCAGRNCGGAEEEKRFSGLHSVFLTAGAGCLFP